ncbi:hypothetical protein [Gemmata sp.]|uniref:hypothetical protein n=1 Tax=Gemmata sp. TaxID=1914242 RepID=UPI003F6E6763
MIETTATFEERVRLAFAPTPRAVVGLVDDLLELGREQPLSLTFRDGTCLVRAAGGASSTVEVPLPRSAFRAVLARVAVLCNEHRPNSVSPYGGTGEVCVGSDSRTTLHVAFTNTPEDQRLEVNG